jgi:hypothetical protein
MKRLVGILLCFCVLLIACNNSNKNSKAKIDSDKIQETAAVQEIADDELYEAWFKNVLLTREYYYTESAEFINANSGGWNMNEDNKVYSKKDRLIMWKRFYQEETLRFSEKYLAVGLGDIVYDCRLESVKKDGNKYTLLLSTLQEEEYEITMLDNGNSIVITQDVAKSGKQEWDVISYTLNYNYVPYDEEKSEETKNKVFAWIDEQVKKLEK